MSLSRMSTWLCSEDYVIYVGSHVDFGLAKAFVNLVRFNWLSRQCWKPHGLILRWSIHAYQLVPFILLGHRCWKPPIFRSLWAIHAMTTWASQPIFRKSIHLVELSCSNRRWWNLSGPHSGEPFTPRNLS